MKQRTSIRVLGVVALLSLAVSGLSTPAPAAAQDTGQPTARPAVRVGVLAQPNSTGFTLETRSGKLAAEVSPATWIIVEKYGRVVEGTISDLAAGKATAVAGMLSQDGKTMAARTVAQGPAARRLADRLARVPRRPLVRAVQHFGSGTITAVEAGRITLRGDRTSEVVVETRPETLVVRGGFSELSTLKVGEHVQVLGVPLRSATARPGTRTLEAWVLRIDSGATGFQQGRMTAIAGNSLTLVNVAGRDRVTINVDGTTQYKRVSITNGQPVVTSATQADLKAGGRVAVDGPVSADGRSMQAKAVILFGGAAQPGQ